jgi:SAM-dependent methyltransferase
MGESEASVAVTRASYVRLRVLRGMTFDPCPRAGEQAGNLPPVTAPPTRTIIPAIPALAGPGVRLFLTSTTILFVELLVIRWIPANVIYVSFFSNFILIASFLGIGLGILLGRADRRLPISPVTLILFGLVLVVLNAQLNLQVTAGDQIFYGLEYNKSADTNFVVLPMLMVAVVALMTTLALPLGGLLRSMPPLRAYAIDIAGSLAGIAAFGVLSAAAFEPTAWFTVVAVLLALLALGRGVTAWSAVPASAMVGVLLLVAGASGTDLWSPYYRVTGADDTGHVVSLHRGTNGPPRHLYVSGIPHQSMDAAALAETNLLQGQVYRWLPERTFERVLIIGAGSGTDTALALRKGSEHIDAVEIDPVIAQIGRDFHPDRPYDDPRVTLHIDDGRAFLRRSTETYDLIVFALTDSLTLVTSTANVRLESFLYTEESFAAARDHLADDGVFIMYNWYREPWLVDKLAGMTADVFGREPLLRLPGPSVGVIGSGPGFVQAAAAGTLGDEVDQLAPYGGSAPTHAADDWPFMYLRNPGVAPYYLVALAVLLGFALVAVALGAKVTKVPLRSGFSPHFFVLGMAFLLLETRSLVTFSLLFGTTWSVNALTFFAILVSVLVSIGISVKFPARRPALLYAGLFGSVALAWLVRPEQLLIDPPVLRYALASGLAFAPILFANLIFAHSIRDTTRADLSFASNLLGATVGGALEYVALLSGYQALLLVVGMLYALAYVLGRRWRVMGDRELADEVGGQPAASLRSSATASS